MKIKVAGALLVVALGLLWFFYGRGEDVEPAGEDPASEKESGRALAGSTDSEPPEPRLIDGNPFIRNYGNEKGSTSADLEALRDVVRDCQLLLKDFDRYHLPGNAGITRFLQGGNPDRLAWIPPGHRLVNEEGELLDRHGIPVFFHRLSGTLFEYRSAGPDRKLWTDDDVVVK